MNKVIPAGGPASASVPEHVQATAAASAKEAATDVSTYCPVCSRRLESRKCKLICTGCGYYMSCSDYY